MAANLPASGVSLVAQNAGQFISSMKGAEGALGSFQRGAGAMSQIVTGALRRVGEVVVNMAATAVRAVAGWLKDSVGVAGDFEQTLNVLGATSGATAAQLDMVSEKAKALGADMTLPATSAQDAAEVMLELSKAGFSVQESMDAAKGALQLSAAAQVDAATAAQITAGAINAFNLEASDSVRIADLLAAGANASSASMTDLSQGLQQAGFAFHAAGMPVEDLVTSLAALTNVGLTGSDSGTALKNALMRLMNPTKKAAGLMASLGFSAYDANDKMKPLPRLIADLNTAMTGMTDEQKNAALGTIFLSDGMKAMIPLLALGEDGFLKLKDQVTVAGSAADVAGAQMKGWNGGIQAVTSQMETLQLIVGTFIKNALAPLLWRLADVVATITTLADRFFKLVPQIQASAAPISTLLSALVLLNPSLSGVAWAILKVVNAAMPLITALTDGSVSGNDLALTLTTLLGPLGATQGAIQAGAGALQQIWAAAQRVVAILSGEMPGALSLAQGALATVVNFVLSTVLPALATAATWFADNLPAAIALAKAAFADVGAFVITLMPTITSIITTALAIVRTIWEKNGQDILFVVTSVWGAIKGAIQVVLGAIQGILAFVLGYMTGDWDTAMTTIQASNTTIWTGIQNFLGGILNAIAGIFGTTLNDLVGLWSSNFRKMGDLLNLVTARWQAKFEEIKTAVSTAMNDAAAVVSRTLNSISGAFSGIVGAINDAISAVKRFLDIVSKIHVPPLITPGSPTPLELGLRGIASATDQAAAAFRAQLAPALGSIPALQPPMMAGATTNTTYGNSYSMPIHTNQSPSVLSQSLALVEALST